MKRLCAAMAALLIFGMATFSLCVMNGFASEDHPEAQPSIFMSME